MQGEVVKRIEKVLKSKRSAEYVKGLAQNTVPKQTYLYQRFIEDSLAKQTPLRPTEESLPTINMNSQDTLMMQEIEQRQQNNLDMDFQDIINE